MKNDRGGDPHGGRDDLRARLKRLRAEGRKPKIVVVGAGFGGLAVTQGLLRRDVEITLVDRQNHHVFQPLLYQVATAGLSPADIAAPIRSIVKRHDNVHVFLGEVVGVDPEGRRVSLSSGAGLDYDLLVLATGARHSYFANPQWSDHAPGIKTIDDATRVRGRILLAMERAETARQQQMSRQGDFITFVIIGGGPTGVEMAGAVAELTRHAAAMDFRFISPNCIKVVLIEAAPRVLATFPADLAAAATKALEKLGVEVRCGVRVTDIDASGVRLADQRLEAAAVIWAAGVQASPAADWLGAVHDRAGRLLVEPGLTVSGRPDIFAIGDTVFLADAKGRGVPGVAPAAKQQGEFVARAILSLLRGKTPRRRFRYRDFGMLATIGRQRAVINFGWLRLSGLPAWLIWSTAHLYFLVGFRNRLLVGMTWFWNYVTFERGARLITGIRPQDLAGPGEEFCPVVAPSAATAGFAEGGAISRSS
jgi:NADH dehydrogenase